jgi:hypothetical protein
VAMRSLKTSMKPVALAVLAGALIYSLAACSNGGPATDGPLGGGAPGGSFLCQPARVGQPEAFGVEVFTNHGHAAIVLDRVALVGGVPWPPGPSDLPPTWKDRQPVHGFRLAPRKSFNMVLGVIATARSRATSQGMRIYYHDTAGSSYLTVDHNKMIIDTTKQECN